MNNYGNTIGVDKATAKLENINVWDSTQEFYPSGAVVKKGSSTEGQIIPAGTPVSVTSPGGEATLNGETVTGLTYQDVVMGSQACTLTIVVRGTLLESRIKATITPTQKAALNGRIVFVEEKDD